MIIGWASAPVFVYVVTITGLTIELVEAVLEIGASPTTFIIAVMLVIFVLGMFLETIAIILITTPIIFPVMLELGINPIWYGILLMINLELALITPPVGMNLFVIKGISGANLDLIIRGIFPYVILMLIGLIIVMVFPDTATWLPKAAGFGR